ncbi:hypothetical protein [Streptomyces sp. NA03103]|uniref:hypothetical protein n=1 Tax=unclassified Streptomyces TaxID=2593676 RepID=UPI0020CB2BF0|nr:hypothetical protein [Streptomyces sp. NA03103]
MTITAVLAFARGAGCTAHSILVTTAPPTDGSGRVRSPLGRLTYALEADSAGTRKASWLYCWDKAGNPTSQDGSKNTCPGGTTYTYNDASELTGKNGSTTGWSYDKLGNETGAAGNTPPHERVLDGLQPARRHHRGR